jgi:hypothetical protein
MILLSYKVGNGSSKINNTLTKREMMLVNVVIV